MTQTRKVIPPGDRLEPGEVGLPIRPFLFTLDQIGTLLELDEPVLKKNHLFFEGRDVGARPARKMLARNLNEPGVQPDWRVAERELIRWCKSKGYRFYERGWTLL